MFNPKKGKALPNFPLDFSRTLSLGEAFILSGHGLDTMTQYANMAIEIPKSAGPLSEWLSLVGHLCDSLLSRWTERQAQIVCLAINPEEPTHEEIARRLNPPVSKQAVTKALNGADWYVIREAIHQFEKTAWKAILPTENQEAT